MAKWNTIDIEGSGLEDISNCMENLAVLVSRAELKKLDLIVNTIMIGTRKIRILYEAEGCKELEAEIYKLCGWPDDSETEK
mgnify:CR=1 FL=1